MIKSFQQILSESDTAVIMSAVKSSLERSSESPFWALKVVPFSEALLSVLVPLRDQRLLFDPEGNPRTTLDARLLLRWCDLVSLKTLAFTLQKSNETGRLERTKHPMQEAQRYEKIDLDTLGRYLSSYTVNLENEALDFPIAHYNLHIGIADVLSKLME